MFPPTQLNPSEPAGPVCLAWHVGLPAPAADRRPPGRPGCRPGATPAAAPGRAAGGAGAAAAAVGTSDDDVDLGADGKLGTPVFDVVFFDNDTVYSMSMTFLRPVVRMGIGFGS